METPIPTSFIPKRPIDTASVEVPRTHRSYGLVSLLIFIAIVVTGGAYAGAYFYEGQLNRQKSSLEAQLAAAHDGIDTTFVTDMRTLNNRINGVKMLLDNHIVVTPVFQALEATTLHTVKYNSFDYAFQIDDATKQKIVVVTVSGTAQSYATIALQSDAFTASSLIKNPVFSNLTVDDTTHNINFQLKFNVDPTKLSYGTTIAPATSAQPQPANTPTQ